MIACGLPDQRVGFVNLALQLPPFTLELCQQHAQGSGQAVLRIFQDAGQRSFTMAASLPDRDPALQQQRCATRQMVALASLRRMGCLGNARQPSQGTTSMKGFPVNSSPVLKASRQKAALT
jgi:hypothetical protein